MRMSKLRETQSKTVVTVQNHVKFSKCNIQLIVVYHFYTRNFKLD